jgi:hypothetical protein
MRFVALTKVFGEDALDAPPISHPLELIVRDPEVSAELFSWAEGAERDGFALDALRFGALAIRQSRRPIDANTVRGEGEPHDRLKQVSVG